MVTRPKDTILRSRSYLIDGDPTAWARAGVNFKHKTIYDAQKNIKLIAGIQLSNTHNDEPYFTGPLELSIRFYMPIPQYKKKKYLEMIGKYHTVRPDTSNLQKWAEDVATGIIFADDCLIASVIAKKIYAVTPRTEFTITQLVSHESE